MTIMTTESEKLFHEYYKTKNLKIRNELIERHLYIAEITAKKFAGRGVDYEDLYQVASLALVKAIERFDPMRGVKFSSYATPSLIGEIKNYFRDSSRVMRLPRRDTEQFQKMNLFVQDYIAKKGKKPTITEISQNLDVPAERVHEILESRQANTVMSLDSSLTAGEDFSLSHLIGETDENFEHVENHDFINYCLELLDETEKIVIKERYIGSKTQKQVAEILDVSQMQISRMERKILAKLANIYKK